MENLWQIFKHGVEKGFLNFPYRIKNDAVGIRQQGRNFEDDKKGFSALGPREIRK
jgi:hypothetical protein